jgi:TonB family protein
MKSRNFTVLDLFLAGTVLIMLVWSVEAANYRQYRVATVPEKTLRQFARIVVTPEYPDDSRRNGSQGVVVAQLNIDEQGVVSKVEILEAPDDSIANAVSKPTKMWMFQPAIDDSTGKAIKLSGKLTFYFVIDSSGAYVRDPK